MCGRARGEEMLDAWLIIKLLTLVGSGMWRSPRASTMLERMPLTSGSSSEWPRAASALRSRRRTATRRRSSSRTGTGVPSGQCRWHLELTGFVQPIAKPGDSPLVSAQVGPFAVLSSRAQSSRLSPHSLDPALESNWTTLASATCFHRYVPATHRTAAARTWRSRPRKLPAVGGSLRHCIHGDTSGWLYPSPPPSRLSLSKPAGSTFLSRALSDPLADRLLPVPRVDCLLGLVGHRCIIPHSSHPYVRACTRAHTHTHQLAHRYCSHAPSRPLAPGSPALLALLFLPTLYATVLLIPTPARHAKRNSFEWLFPLIFYIRMALRPVCPPLCLSVSLMHTWAYVESRGTSEKNSRGAYPICTGPYAIRARVRVRVRVFCKKCYQRSGTVAQT
jgi:hypothetical protein